MFSQRISNSINVSISLFSTSRRYLHLGFVTRVTDEIVYCLGLPKIYFDDGILYEINNYINNYIYNDLVIDTYRLSKKLLSL